MSSDLDYKTIIDLIKNDANQTLLLLTNLIEINKKRYNEVVRFEKTFEDFDVFFIQNNVFNDKTENMIKKFKQEMNKYWKKLTDFRQEMNNTSEKSQVSLSSFKRLVNEKFNKYYDVFFNEEKEKEKQRIEKMDEKLEDLLKQATDILQNICDIHINIETKITGIWKKLS